MKIRYSQAFSIFLLIIGLLLLGLTFSLVMKPLSLLYNSSYSLDVVSDPIYQDFFMKTRTIWIWLPAIAGVFVLMWSFTEAHRRRVLG